MPVGKNALQLEPTDYRKKNSLAIQKFGNQQVKIKSRKNKSGEILDDAPTFIFNNNLNDNLSVTYTFYNMEPFTNKVFCNIELLDTEKYLDKNNKEARRTNLINSVAIENEDKDKTGKSILISMIETTPFISKKRIC